MQMNIFNPEHDLCIANGDANFVPPSSALEFGKDCSGLTAWIEEACDNEIIPWGWNPVLKRRLEKDGIPDMMLPSDAAIAEIRRLSHRSTAARAGAYIDACLHGSSLLRPLSYIRELSDLHDVVEAVDEYGEAVMKAPLSGSGRGLRWARRGELSASDMGWCRNVISRQGSVMVEKRLEIVRDFAMLFHVSGNNASFEGCSLFFNDNGTYRGNVLASDSYILSELSRYLPETLITGVKDALTCFLEQEFCGRYTGYAGVDMFIYREGATYNLAPAVELNVRMTMGLLARRLFDRHMFSDGHSLVLLPPGQKAEGLAHEMKPALLQPGIDGRYIMSVEFCSAPGTLYAEASSFLGTLAEVTPSSRYTVAVTRS